MRIFRQPSQPLAALHQTGCPAGWARTWHLARCPSFSGPAYLAPEESGLHHPLPPCRRTHAVFAHTHTSPSSRLGGPAGVAASQAAEQPPEPQPAPNGLVFGLGALGSWDEAAVGSPVVRCYMGDDEQRWFMWYSGRRSDSPAAAGVDALAPSSGSIGVAVSRDGIRWFRGSDVIEGARGSDAAGDVGAVMGPNQDWWTFDTCHLAPADVQVLSNSSVSSSVGVYWMFYSGGDFEPVVLPDSFPTNSGTSSDGDGSGSWERRAVEGLRLRPGLAMSQDGRNWARIEADHHTGALFEAGGASELKGDKTLLFNGSMQVLAVGPHDMRMYYTAYDTSRRRFVVALAASPDGFKWTQKGIIFDPAAFGGTAAAASDDEDSGITTFDALGPAALSVVRDIDNRQFLMYYEAVAIDNRRSIGLAVSKDGTSWRRYPKPVLEPTAEPGPSESDPWDGGDVGSPCAVSMSGGRWRLYYGGRKKSGQGPWHGIGLALSVEGGPTFAGVPVQYERRVPKPEPAS